MRGWAHTCTHMKRAKLELETHRNYIRMPKYHFDCESPRKILNETPKENFDWKSLRQIGQKIPNEIMTGNPHGIFDWKSLRQISENRKPHRCIKVQQYTYSSECTHVTPVMCDQAIHDDSQIAHRKFVTLTLRNCTHQIRQKMLSRSHHARATTRGGRAHHRCMYSWAVMLGCPAGRQFFFSRVGECLRACLACLCMINCFFNCVFNFFFDGKNLAVGSLIWSAKTGVKSSYFLQKFSTCPVLCCILTLLGRRVDWACLELL